MYGLDDIKEAKGMHIAHINVGSMTNKWELIKMNFMSTNLHVLVISETWLNVMLHSGLYEYTLIRNDRSWQAVNSLLPTNWWSYIYNGGHKY